MIVPPDTGPPLPANATKKKKASSASASSSSSGPAPPSPSVEGLPLTGTARSQPSKGSKTKATSITNGIAPATAADAMNGQNHLRQMRGSSHAFVPSPVVPVPVPPQGGLYAQNYPQHQQHHQQQQQQGHPHPQQQQQQHYQQQQQYHQQHQHQQYQQHPQQQQQQPHGGYPYQHPGMLNPPPPPPLPPLPPPPPPSFDPALIDAMQHEVDFLFSLENLTQDYTIAKYMRSASIPVTKLLALPRIKHLLASVNLTSNGGGPERFLLAQAVGRSKVVVLSEQEKKIGRRDHSTGGDLAWRCVVITNLPSDSTEGSVKALVSKYGEVARIKLGGEGGGEEGEGDGREGRRVIVQFALPDGALKCVDALGGAKSNWRVSHKVAYLNGYTVAQMTQILGVGGMVGGGGGGGGGERGATAAAATASAATNGGAPKEGVSLALPPVIPEGEHIGVILEVDGGGGAGAGRGVLKREGRRRTIISFQLPVDLTLAVGDRVAFSVKHVENKAVVQNVTMAPPLSSLPSSSSSAPSSSSSSSVSSTAGGGGGGAGSKVGKNGSTMAKGPDTSLGFKLPRTKPPPELVELLEALKLGGGGKKEGKK